jgi:crotonobetainyl-CoA:carnitine CoA-transferase CaiB-like acyl-CoA transferase
MLYSFSSFSSFSYPLSTTLPASAMYGMMHITGDSGGNPVKPGVAVTDVLTGALRSEAKEPTLIHCSN